MVASSRSAMAASSARRRAPRRRIPAWPPPSPPGPSHPRSCRSRNCRRRPRWTRDSGRAARLGMATGTGQRRDAAAETAVGGGDPPAVTVHAAAEAALALSLAGNRGVLLLSAPGAAGFLGPAWFLGIVGAA